MFKLPHRTPVLTSSSQDWADYAEYLALKKGGDTVSLSEIVRTPMLISDEININGIEDDTDGFENIKDEITSEINYRSFLCQGNYPFRLENRDYGIAFLPSEDVGNTVYQYLLMSTRVKMTGPKRFYQGIDGTLLFEQLSAEVAKAFFGEKSQVAVLGTGGEPGGFRDKLDDLIQRMGEGGSIHTNEGHRPQDDNVDVVVWKGFRDRRSSQMIAFGQCKTGTSWSESLSELNTDAFCKTWFTRQPVLTPVRLFFCAQDFPRRIWDVRAYEAGLVFDRYRIMEYLPKTIDEGLLFRIKRWTDAALES